MILIILIDTEVDTGKKKLCDHFCTLFFNDLEKK